MSHAWYYDAKWLTKEQRAALRAAYNSDRDAYHKLCNELIAKRTFERAFRALPGCVNEDGCETIADLKFRVQFEIDLCEEGDSGRCSRAELRSCRTWMKNWGVLDNLAGAGR